MKRINWIVQLLIGVVACSFMALAQASEPLWTFAQVKEFPATVTVSQAGSATVKYTVTNQSRKNHTLVIQPQRGVSQTQPCQLGPKDSAQSTCTLTLMINGSALPSSGISEGPFLCQANSDGTPNPTQCYQPSIANSLNIKVTSAPALVSIAVTPFSSSIAQGTTQQFVAVGIYSDSSVQNITSSVTWSSSSPAIATISNASGSPGLATGVSAGSTTISATLGSVSGSTSLAVTNATLVSIAVTPPSSTIANSSTEQFSATGTFSDSSTQDLTNSVTWTSSSPATATISNTSGSQGLASGVAAGSTTITATLGAVSGNASLVVTNATLVSIAVTPHTSRIARGLREQFSAIGTYSDSSTQDITDSVSWLSSNTAVATISNTSGSKGLATGLAVGSTTITATLGSVSGTAGLVVTNATIVSIAVTPTNPVIASGTTQQFVATATFSDSSTHNITNLATWFSSTVATAVISNAPGSKGLATGAAVGSTSISATFRSVSGSTTLAVTNATLVSISVTPSNSQIAAGFTQQFSAIGTYTDSSTQDLTSSVSWSSSSTAVASISNASGSNGLATGASAGSTTITATLNGVSGTASLSVTAATLVSIEVTPPTPTIASGTTQQFVATGIFSDSTTHDITSSVTWLSSNQGVAVISNASGSYGLATGVAVGSTNITATLGLVTGGTSLSVTGATLVSIAVTPPNSRLAKGSSQQFTAIGTYTDTTTQNLSENVTWFSSNAVAATISNAAGSKGLATGLAAGVTTISATLGSVSGSTNLVITNATLVSIAISPTNPSIANGTTQQFSAIGTFSDSSTHNITNIATWSSSITGVAAISNASGSKGLATGASAGSTTITASVGAVSGTTSLVVTTATLVSIAVTPFNAQIAKGLTVQYTAMGTYSDNTTQELTNTVSWSSLNTAVASISNASGSNGVATGVSAGSTTITATLNGVSGTANLAVNNASLVSIAITPPDPTIAKGTTQQFTATGTYTDSSTHDLTNNVTWASSSQAVASISNAPGSYGLASGQASGSTTITATLGSVSNSTSLEVTPETLVSIAITPPSKAIANGTTQQFSAMGTYTDSSTQDLTTQVTWFSSNPAATISNDARNKGLATGVSPGATTITATLNSVTGSASLFVTNATLVSIAVTPSVATIANGTSQQFIATGTFSDATTQDLTSTVLWASSNTGIAPISNDSGSKGVATGMSAGSVTITATLGAVANTASLEVTAATLVSIAVTPPNPQIAKGLTVGFTAMGTYSDTTTQELTNTVSWSSLNTAVASISNASSSNGVATGVSAGSTTITATLNGVSGTANLVVTNATLVSIAVTPSTASIAAGTTQQYIAIGTFTDFSTLDITSAVNWSSSSNSVATVSNVSGSKGFATAGAFTGTTTITAQLNSVSGSATLTVTSAVLVSLAITPLNSQIPNGTTQQFTAMGTYSDTSTQEITSTVSWQSSNEAAATISNVSGSNGRATGLNAGLTTISATQGSVVSNTTNLVVTNATLVSIAVTPPAPEIANGQTQQFTATGTYTDASTRDITKAVTWQSSNLVVASISNAPGSKGLATAASFGLVTISATLNAVSGNTSLEVTAPTTVSIAAGSYRDDSSVTRPLLVRTQDLGGTWIYPESITAPDFNTNQFANNGQFASANCIGTTCMAVGSYMDTSATTRPLLALSQDLGTNWSYLESITAPDFTEGTPPSTIHPFRSNGLFYGTSCIGTFCIATGSYMDTSLITRPLLAQSQDLGATWTYPASITNPDLVPAFYNTGIFYNANCNGSICIAVGAYDSANSMNSQRPLLAQSTDSGATWTYPANIPTPSFTNTFQYGAFQSGTCNGTTCIAVGYYYDAQLTSRPLLAHSSDSGATWAYNESITTPLFTPPGTIYLFQSAGSFWGVSCNATLCIAVGQYRDDSNIQRPLLAQSIDSGVTWTYPASITEPSFTPASTNSFGAIPGTQGTTFLSASCNSTTCIAVGSYTDSSVSLRPLLARSSDFGVTWVYPDSITSPPSFGSLGVLAHASCTDTICIAAGIYNDASFISRPLLAQSTDSGVNWAYPASIPAPVFSPTDTYPFANRGGFKGSSSNSWAPKWLHHLMSNE